MCVEAQHLVSALAESHFGWDTTSWECGSDRCNVELSTTRPEQPITDERLAELLTLINDAIRAARPVSVTFTERPTASAATADNEQQQQQQVPKGHHGPLRTVCIAGIDNNPCCGTHVSNTSELQMVAFLGTESARKNTRLFFVAGNRVLRLFDTMQQRERALKDILSTGAHEFVEQVGKMHSNLRASLKTNKALLEEVADAVVDKLVSECGAGNAPQVLAYQREQADAAFLMHVVNGTLQRVTGNHVMVVAAGGGVFVLGGHDAAAVRRVGPLVATDLGGGSSGGGRPGRFQGKAPSLAAFPAAVLRLQSLL
jgi:misacylated tRNA(Ala) deacylase